MFGRGLVRRSTATSCRSVRIRTSFAASELASSASQPYVLGELGDPLRPL
jgi:hypothetical protein